MIGFTKTRFAALAIATIASTALAGAASASGGGGGDGVTSEGRCNGTSDWKLQAKPRDGGLEVEYEIDSNVNGQVWQVRLSDNGSVLFAGNRTTVAPSGSFEVNVNTANRAGPDRILGLARNVATGEICVGRVTHP